MTNTQRRPAPRACALLAALATLAGSCATPAAWESAEFLIRNVNVVDTRTGAVQTDRAIVINNERIVSVIADSAARNIQAEVVVEGRGAYAIPGLWDSHMHIMQEDVDGALRQLAPLALSAGITHARDMGSSIAARAAFLRATEEGHLDAPYVIGAGPAFWAFELPYGDKRQQRIVADPDETEAAVNEVADAGVDFIKVYAGFEAARLQRLIQAARQRGLRVAGHAQPNTPLDEQARLGMLTVEHLDFATLEDCGADSDAFFSRVISARFRGSGENVPSVYAEFGRAIDVEQCRAVFRRAAQAGLVLTPTLMTVFLPQTQARRLSENAPAVQRESCDLFLRQFEGVSDAEQAALADTARALMRIVLDAGVPIVAGTDAPLFCAVPGEALSYELALLSDAGLSPLAVLQSATLLPSRLFGGERRLGTIEPGMEAHVVLLQQNPMETVSAYQHPVGVLTRGRWRDEAALVEVRRSALAHSDSPGSEAHSH